MSVSRRSRGRSSRSSAKRTGKAAGVVRFAGAVVSQLTAASYAIERREELGAEDVAQLYAPFDPFVPLALLG